MPEDLYNDGPDAGGGTPESQEDESPSKTALLPKSCFPDAKVGDSISVKVVGVHESELEVEAAGDCKSGSLNDESVPEEDNDGPMRSMLED